MKILWLLIVLAWLFAISEFILTLVKRSSVSKVTRRNDRGSLILIWFAITIGLAVGFNLGRYDNWNIYNYLVAISGCLVYVAGMVLRWLSIVQLRESFTVDVAVSKQQELKTNGLYRFVRHPSYSGILLILTGLSMGMNNILSVVIIIIPVFLAILYRIKVEEKVLSDEFGSKYLDYSKKTRMLIPWLF
jgi:protein-S-isoprenylcysteine O-methyltransferase Ste14